jgi:hypothetical protein
MEGVMRIATTFLLIFLLALSVFGQTQRNPVLEFCTGVN